MERDTPFDQAAYKQGKRAGAREATLQRDIERIYAQYRIAATVHTALAVVGVYTVTKWLARRLLP